MQFQGSDWNNQHPDELLADLVAGLRLSVLNHGLFLVDVSTDLG